MANSQFSDWTFTREWAQGDGLLIYPGPDGPIASIRLANIRDGVEDYEYLHALAAQTDFETAQAYCRTVANGLHDANSFTHDAEYLRQQRSGIIDIINSSKATVISPVNNERVARNVILRWAAGNNAASHNVYVGTSYNAVNNATTSSSEFKGNQSASVYNAGTLNYGQSYYWRIDEVGSSTVKGDVWQFNVHNLSVGWWKFDESSGSTANDSGSANNDGTLVNGPSHVSGYKNRALRFNQYWWENEYVRINNHASLNLTNTFSASVWVKLDFWWVDWAAIISKGNANASGWRLGRAGDENYLCFAVNDGSGSPTGHDEVEASGGPDMDDGQWHHVVVTYDGQLMMLFVDAQCVDYAYVDGNMTASSDNLNIGRNSVETSFLWNGWIDEVKYFNIALNRYEIKALMIEP